MAAEEQTSSWIIGILATAVAGLYGFFIKHTVNHPDAEKFDKARKELDDKKQDKKVCEQIVKRIDENQEAMKKALENIDGNIDRVLEFQQNGGAHGRVRT